MTRVRRAPGAPPGALFWQVRSAPGGDCMKSPLSLALPLLGVLAIAAASPSEMPRIIRAADPQTPYPIWVAADAALTAEGKLDNQLIAPHARERVEQLVATRTEQARHAAPQ